MNHNQRNPNLRFFRYVRPYRRLVFAASLCFVISGFLGAYPIQLFKKAVDIALGDTAGNAGAFYWLACLYLLLRVALGGMQLVESAISKKLVQKVIFDLQSDLVAHLQSLSIGFYETREAGEVLSRALGDTAAVAGGLMEPLTRLAGELAQLLWALYFLVQINPRLMLLALIVAPPLGYAVYWFGNKMRDLAWKVRSAQGSLWSLFLENIAGMREIQIFGREAHELRRFQERVQVIDRLGLQDAALNATLTSLAGLLFSAGEMMILLVGGLSVYRGGMTAGNLTAFLMFVRLLYNPVITISRRYDQTQRTLASAARVFELLDTPPEVSDRPGANPLESVIGEVRFKRVSYGYRKDQEVLHGLSFIAGPGEMVALVGHSGGGKTTLSKLIPRFYDPDSGCIFLDGHDLRDVTLRSLRSHIAAVFQEPFLFNSSIRDNIAYGRPGAGEEEILAAARAANAHEFIMGLPEQYATVIGERGVKLSGGQRQRIAIARALLKNPRILILDEATSSVDSETERLIQEALDRLLKGRTSIVIAHRLSTIIHADRILVVEDGRIVEQGTHTELLALDGAYCRLYRAQMNEDPTGKGEGHAHAANTGPQAYPA